MLSPCDLSLFPWTRVLLHFTVVGKGTTEAHFRAQLPVTSLNYFIASSSLVRFYVSAHAQSEDEPPSSPLLLISIPPSRHSRSVYHLISPLRRVHPLMEAHLFFFFVSLKKIFVTWEKLFFIESSCGSIQSAQYCHTWLVCPLIASSFCCFKSFPEVLQPICNQRSGSRNFSWDTRCQYMRQHGAGPLRSSKTVSFKSTLWG